MKQGGGGSASRRVLLSKSQGSGLRGTVAVGGVPVNLTIGNNRFKRTTNKNTTHYNDNTFTSKNNFAASKTGETPMASGNINNNSKNNAMEFLALMPTSSENTQVVFNTDTGGNSSTKNNTNLLISQ